MRKTTALSIALALGLAWAGSVHAEGEADRTQDGGMGFDTAAGTGGVTGDASAGIANTGERGIFDMNGNNDGNGFMGPGGNGGDLFGEPNRDPDANTGITGMPGTAGAGNGTWFGNGNTGGGFLGTRGGAGGLLGNFSNGYSGGTLDTAGTDRNGAFGTNGMDPNNGLLGTNGNNNGGMDGTADDPNGNSYTAFATGDDGVDWGWLGLLGLFGLSGLRSRNDRKDSPRL